MSARSRRAERREGVMRKMRASGRAACASNTARAHRLGARDHRPAPESRRERRGRQPGQVRFARLRVDHERADAPAATPQEIHAWPRGGVDGGARQHTRRAVRGFEFFGTGRPPERRSGRRLEDAAAAPAQRRARAHQPLPDEIPDPRDECGAERQRCRGRIHRRREQHVARTRPRPTAESRIARACPWARSPAPPSRTPARR